MSFVLTYQTLTATLQQYLERQDPRFLENIPTFILLGQRRVTRDLKILQIKVFRTGSLTADTASMPKPGDWLNNSYFSIGTGDGQTTSVQLEQRSYNYCKYFWPDATQVGQPKYYASDHEFGDFYFFPTPDQNYPFELGYFGTPPFLDETTGTNALTATIPEALEYATLLETASFLKDDERIAVWTGYYNTARENITNEDIQRIYDGFVQRRG
jgi:hypothetical protein